MPWPSWLVHIHFILVWLTSVDIGHDLVGVSRISNTDLYYRFVSSVSVHIGYFSHFVNFPIKDAVLRWTTVVAFVPFGFGMWPMVLDSIFVIYSWVWVLVFRHLFLRWSSYCDVYCHASHCATKNSLCNKNILVSAVCASDWHTWFIGKSNILRYFTV